MPKIELFFFKCVSDFPFSFSLYVFHFYSLHFYFFFRILTSSRMLRCSVKFSFLVFSFQFCCCCFCCFGNNNKLLFNINMDNRFPTQARTKREGKMNEWKRKMTQFRKDKTFSRQLIPPRHFISPVLMRKIVALTETEKK